MLLLFFSFKILFFFCCQWVLVLIIGEFSLKYSEHIVDGFYFEVGACRHFFRGIGEDVLSGVATHSPERFDDPVVDFVVELFQIDVVLHVNLVGVTIYIDVIACKSACEFDVVSALTDGEAHLVVLHIYFCEFP